jgi:hypothetical protein
MDKNDRWIIDHFEEIVDKYGGECIAVVNEEIVAIDPSLKRVEEEAEKKYPDKEPSVLRVPKKESLVCILIL